MQFDVRGGAEGGADRRLRFLADVFVFLGQVVQQRLGDLARFVGVFRLPPASSGSIA